MILTLTPEQTRACIQALDPQMTAIVDGIALSNFHHIGDTDPEAGPIDESFFGAPVDQSASIEEARRRYIDCWTAMEALKGVDNPSIADADYEFRARLHTATWRVAMVIGDGGLTPAQQRLAAEDLGSP